MSGTSRRRRSFLPTSQFHNKDIQYDRREESAFLADLRKGNPPANLILREGVAPLLLRHDVSSGMSSPAGLCADVVHQ